jgi:hypothetical protein
MEHQLHAVRYKDQLHSYLGLVSNCQFSSKSYIYMLEFKTSTASYPLWIGPMFIWSSWLGMTSAEVMTFHRDSLYICACVCAYAYAYSKI